MKSLTNSIRLNSLTNSIRLNSLTNSIRLNSLTNSIRLNSLTNSIRQHVLLQLRARASIQDAEDAFQEACLHYLQHTAELTDEGELIAWLLTAARRVLLDQNRHASTLICISLDKCPLSPSCDIADAVIFKIVVCQALQVLTTEECKMLTMRAIGKTCKEVADECHITEAAAKKRWERTRLHCQHSFKNLLTE